MCKVQGEYEWYGETKAGLRASFPERTLGKNYCFPALEGGGGGGRGKGREGRRGQGEGRGRAGVSLPPPSACSRAGGRWLQATGRRTESSERSPLDSAFLPYRRHTVSEMQNSPEVDERRRP